MIHPHYSAAMFTFCSICISIPSTFEWILFYEPRLSAIISIAFIEGENADSEVRHLKDGSRKAFQQSGSDSFVMSTQHSLGDLLYVHLWHDNSGGGWYVRCVKKNRKAAFLWKQALGYLKVDLYSNQKCAMARFSAIQCVRE